MQIGSNLSINTDASDKAACTGYAKRWPARKAEQTGYP